MDDLTRNADFDAKAAAAALDDDGVRFCSECGDPMLSYDVFERLDKIEATLAGILQAVDTIREHVEPTIDALKNSPLLRMLGVK